ncbi:MAG: DUF5682 family protein [Roseiflexaceae bacterium]|nr:DUF5682 family protein [Roseiflexaceae bacterium]
MITLLGIRHHGPGSARSVRHALHLTQPDCLLVEGPPEADPLISFTADPAMTPPVALLIYRETQPTQAVFYPFAEFSPEWQALRYAKDAGIPVHFVDLPLRQWFALPTTDETPSSADPFAQIAAAAGYDDPERWWDHVVEQRRDVRDLFLAILELMVALRAEADAHAPPDSLTRAREAAMRTALRRAQREGFTNIAVVCGAWHAPALLDLDNAQADERLIVELSHRARPVSDVRAAWIPWTYDRLARHSGYGAGIDSPGWYEHLWNVEHDIVAHWMTRTAHVLRAEGLNLSPAHVIEATRLSEALAALRGRSLPDLGEIEEAIQAVFCGGNDTPLRLIRKRLIIGQKIGSVPPDAPAPPLQRDIEATLKRLRLTLYLNEPAVLEIDLRKPSGLERSRFLHRLALLGIAWGEAFTPPGAQGTFREIWRLTDWAPEFVVRIIEASRLGNTVEAAAAASAREQALRAGRLPDVIEILGVTLLADLPDALNDVLARVEALASTTGDIAQLMQALPGLIQTARYSNVRKSDVTIVRTLAVEILTRVCVGLPLACMALSDEAAKELFERLVAVHRHIPLLEDEAQTQTWRTTLARLADMPAHGLIQGLATRLLHDEGEGSGTAIRMNRALSPAVAPATAAVWLEGFLSGDALALIHNPNLWRILDDWLISLPEPAFVAQLPILRRAFQRFEPAARRQLGELARNGPIISMREAPMQIDDARAKRALALLRLIEQAEEASGGR